MISPQTILNMPHQKMGKLQAFFIASSLRTFSLALVGLFLPILVYMSFLQLGQREAMLIMIGYFILGQTLQMISAPLVIKLARRIGVRAVLVLSMVATVFFVYFAAREMYILAFIAVAVLDSFWWFPYHYYFLREGTGKAMGKQVGMMELLFIVTASIAPLTAGIILTFATDQILYLLGGIVAIATMVTLMMMHEPPRMQQGSYRKMLHEARQHPTDMLAFVGAGAEEVANLVAWPLLLYFIFGDFLSLGIFYAGVILFVAVINLMLGAQIDRRKKDAARLEHIGALGIFAVWVGRAAFPNPIAVTILEILYKVLYSFFRLPLIAISYHHAKHSRERYLAMRQFSYKVGSVLLLLIFWLIVYVGLPTWLILVVAGLTALLPGQVTDEEVAVSDRNARSD